MSQSTNSSTNEPQISLVENAEDLKQAYYCTSQAFGRQTNDAVWGVVNPGWETPEGQHLGASKLIKRWESVNTNKDGKPNTVFLKATLPDPNDGEKRRVVGVAIWQQCSFVDGWGDKPSEDLGSGLDGLAPTNARFAAQMFRSLWKRRISYTHEKATASPPAIFVLDMCAVDPAFQRRGIAQKLVQWGLEEAKRRGDLECTTEASVMGRGAYRKLGFKDEGVGDIVFEVDEEFKDWDKPPNVFLRTGIKD